MHRPHGDGHGRAWLGVDRAILHLPQVFVRLDCSANCHPSFSMAERFAVNILSADHAQLRVGWRPRGSTSFGPEAFELSELRLPILPDALVMLECRTAARLPGGDHTICSARRSRPGCKRGTDPGR
jgi:flavin reductase ActVB